MKKFFFMLATLALPVALSAQSLNAPALQGALHRDYSPKAIEKMVNKAPARVELAANQKIMGHYDTDSVMTGGYLGLTGLPGVIPIATILTPDELSMFQKGKIVAFRVGLASSTPVTRVFVAPVEDGYIGTTTEWECNVGAEGWNTIELDTPYEIDLDSDVSLMIGFDYEQTSSNYPISAVNVGEVSTTYAYLTYNGSTSWYNVGLDSYGNLSLQCIVESDYYADYKFQISNLSSLDYVLKSTQEIPFTFDARSLGTKDIEAGNYTCTVAIDGIPVGTITGDVALTSEWVTLSSTIINSGLEVGTHTLSVTTATLNGETIPADEAITLTKDFVIYTEKFPRQKHLVEQLTSSSCTYCPLGTGLLETLNEMRDDIAWTSIHGTLYSQYPDPYDYEQCDTLNAFMGLSGWPSGAFDRMNGWSGEEGIVGSLGYYEQYHEQIAAELSNYLDYVEAQYPSFATINIASEMTDEDTREATVLVYGELADGFETLFPDARLTVYFTEDSLISKQLNQGKWISQYVHNGVLRQALPSVFGEELQAGTNADYSNSYTVTIPEGWNLDNLYVVAFISKPLNSGSYSYMFVNQTEKALFGTGSAPVGIEDVTTDTEVVPVGYYDIMGRQHNSLQPGINIVKMSNGTARKVLVK